MKTEKDIDFFFPCKMKQNHVPTHCNNQLTSFPDAPIFHDLHFPAFQSLFISSNLQAISWSRSVSLLY